MKVNLFNLYGQQAQLVINQLAESKEADIQTMRMAVRLLKATKDHNEELQAIVDKINEEYQPHFVDVKSEDKKAKLEREINERLVKEFLAAEVEVDIELLTMEQLHKAGLNAKEIFVLDWLLSDK